MVVPATEWPRNSSNSNMRLRSTGDAPKKILLDFDSTDDPTHGKQEGSYYHGYYEQHMYHILIWSSTARRVSSLQPFCELAIPTPAVGRWRY